MSMLTELDWSAYVYHNVGMGNPDFQTECGIGLVRPTGEEVIKVEHFVLALYMTGVAIAQQQKFFKVRSGIFLHGTEIGFIDFQPKQPKPYSSYLTVDSTSTNTSLIALGAGDSGYIIDVTDPKFKIRYTWDGVKLQSQGVFTAFLNAFAIAAPYEGYEYRAQIHA